MKTVIALVIKDIRLFLNDPAVVLLTFAVPLVLITIFGSIFGGGSTGPNQLPLALLVEEEGNAAYEALVESLEEDEAFAVITTWTDDEGVAQPLDEAKIRELMQANRLRYALILPETAMEEFALNIRFLYNPRSDIEYQMVNGLLQQKLFAEAMPAMFSPENLAGQLYTEEEIDAFFDGMARLISESFDAPYDEVRADLDLGNWMAGFGGGDANGGDGEGEDEEMAMFGSFMNIEDEQVVGEEVRNPGATRSVINWSVMFLFFTMSGAATSLLEERHGGIFYRLLSGPVTRTQVLWSKYVYLTLLGMVQFFVLFLFGWIFFGVDMWPHFGMLMLAALMVVLAANGMGMLIAAITRTSAAASGLATLVTLVMAALGGSMIPVSMMPTFMQVLAPFTIVYWGIEALMGAVWHGQSALELWKELGVLLAIAVVLIGLSQWQFRRGDIFR